MKYLLQRTIKIFIILLLTIFLFYMPIVNASYWGDIFDSGKEFFEQGKNSSENVIDEYKLQEEVNKIYNILFSLGVVLSVIVGAILGIKYMFGSIEQQVKVKELLLPYVIACIIIFGAFGIWKIVIEIASQVS